MSREVHVRFCESPEVRFLRATHPFVRLRSYWIYLAVMVDAFSRRCVGWALGTRITTELTLEALQMAIVSRRPKATLVHHSDRGSQYGSSGYQDALLERELKQSWSRPGTPTDNPVCERFIGTLKREEIWVRAYVDFEDACIGPVEWDLAFLPADGVAMFRDVDLHLLVLLRPLNSARVATWCGVQARFPAMRIHGEHHLGLVRRAWPKAT